MDSLITQHYRVAQGQSCTQLPDWDRFRAIPPAQACAHSGLGRMSETMGRLGKPKGYYKRKFKVIVRLIIASARFQRAPVSEAIYEILSKAVNERSDLESWSVTRWVKAQNIISLKGLTPDAVRMVAKMMSILRTTAKKFVTYEGGSADSLLILVEGKARVLKRDDDGKDPAFDWSPDNMQFVKNLSAGHSYGEMDLQTDRDAKYSSSIYADSPCTFITIPRKIFQTIFRQSKDVESKVKLLQAVEPFSSLNADKMTQLAYCMHRVGFSSGQLLYEQSHYPNQCYIITKGSVRLETDLNESGRHANLAASQLTDCTRRQDDIKKSRDPPKRFKPRDIKPGTKVVASILADQVQCFQVHAGSQNKVTFQFRALDGSPSMFISCRTYTPNEDEYTWASSHRDRFGCLEIEPDDAYYEDGKFYVGISAGKQQGKYELLVEEMAPGSEPKTTRPDKFSMRRNVNATKQITKSKGAVPIVTLSPPSFCGLFEVLFSSPRRCSAVAITHTEAYAIDRSHFLMLIQRKIRQEFVDVVAARWRHRDNILKEKKEQSANVSFRLGVVEKKSGIKSSKSFTAGKRLKGVMVKNRMRQRNLKPLARRGLGRSTTPKASRRRMQMPVKLQPLGVGPEELKQKLTISPTGAGRAAQYSEIKVSRHQTKKNVSIQLPPLSPVEGRPPMSPNTRLKTLLKPSASFDFADLKNRKSRGFELGQSTSLGGHFLNKPKGY